MPDKSPSWLKDWKNIAAAVAVVASAWASVRGEIAKDDASSAKGKANSAQVEAKDAKKNAANNATVVLAVLNERLDRLEGAEKEVRLYMAAMDQRDKYMERMLWDIYRSERGSRAADRVVAAAPPKPAPLPLVSHKRRPTPKNAAAATAQYQRACEVGDPLCADDIFK